MKVKSEPEMNLHVFSPHAPTELLGFVFFNEKALKFYQ